MVIRTAFEAHFQRRFVFANGKTVSTIGLIFFVLRLQETDRGLNVSEECVGEYGSAYQSHRRGWVHQVKVQMTKGEVQKVCSLTAQTFFDSVNVLYIGLQLEVDFGSRLTYSYLT